uniref:hypothetical protein n=1 Tax=Candidatus Puniceispirillum sp. TaxID=2026719 RepID=UPI003F69BC04
SIETRKQRRTKQLSAIIYAMEQVREYNSMNAQPSNESGSTMTSGYVEAKAELATIQSDVSAEHLRSSMAVIASDNYKGWIVYDLDLADVKSKNKPYLYITLASILGGFMGVVYVLIINAARTRKERLASA